MRSPLQALIWEQTRVAGAIALMLFAVGLLLTIMGLDPNFYKYIENEFPFFASIAMYTGAVLFLFRNDARAHLVLAYESRLARLPVNTVPLVLIPFLARFFGLILLGTALCAVHHVLIGPPAELEGLLGALVLYAVLQTLCWTRTSITGASYGLLLLLFVGPLIAQLGDEIYWRGFSYEEYYALLTGLATNPVSAPLIILACIVWSVVGVHWVRRDERHGLPTPSKLWERINTGAHSKDRKFGSALEAQVWYEWKRVGWILPLISVAITLLLSMLLAAFGADDEHTGGLLAQYLPYAALLMAAAFTGLKIGTGIASSRGNTVPFPFLRPASSATLAHARLLVGARALFFALVPAVVFSCGLWYIFADAELRFLRSAYHHGHVTRLHMASYVFGPMLAAVGIAWFLLWMEQKLDGFIVIIVGFTFAGFALLVANEPDLLAYGAQLFVVLVFVVVMQSTFSRLKSSWHEGRLSIRQGTILVVAISLGAYLFWLAGARPIWTRAVGGLVITALMLAPFFDVPRGIAQRRTQ